MRKRGWNIWGGGKHQKLARLALVAGGVVSNASGSDLPMLPVRGPLDGDAEVDTLLELWAMGLLSAITLQMIASSACKVAPREQMVELSRIGTEGVWRGNAHRDLKAKINMGNLDVKIARPCFIHMPLRDSRKRPVKTVHKPYPIMLPHVFLDQMYTNYRQ